MKKAINGFTLVELMVTVAVAAILLAVASPSMVSLYEGNRARSAIGNIETAFLQARSQAISYGIQVTICPLVGTNCSTDWSGGYSIFIDVAPINSLNTDDLLIATQSAINSSDFIKSSANSFTFNPDGMLNATNAGSMVYCPGDTSSANSRGISIGVSGRVTELTGSNCT
ncbi:GspH/FimT family pseudopilin [Shewanella electrodiphila]|uniref:Type II secretion system protein H n=1 Tax=Shewanella electrodiphila TaxID=934143 RepID=A0ABT0KK15_9GAMM|nr:GspH/FimT family pseudopilin [Shewanella electrodiphila]MCL1044078.1 GspH/FimT family pseudopilin [Shewanella electrodiphila]